MSFSMMMAPLFTRDAGDWIAMARYSYGVPHQPPPERDFPTVEQVLSAFRQASCHGWAFARVRGPSAPIDLPPCPDPAACAESDGLHLGEIGLQIDDQGTPKWSHSTSDELEPDAPVTALQFRNPTSRGLLAAALALAPRSGPLLVFDDIDTVFVVSADDDPSRMAGHWLRLMGSFHRPGRTGPTPSGD
jgi:hypothetical protein